MPMPACLILLLAGLALIYFTSKKRVGYYLSTFAVILFLGFSTPILSVPMMSSLESQYLPGPTPEEVAGVETILVLGSGHGSDERLNSSLQSLRMTGVLRLSEGVRLYFEEPDRQLVTSGYSRYDDVPNAVRVAEAAVELGVAREDIRMHTAPRDTNQEAIAMKEYIREQPFLLVTSASHMPRTMALFQHHGMNPIAAPADVMTKGPQIRAFTDLLPNSDSLLMSEKAIHEYAGILWFRISTLSLW